MFDVAIERPRRAVAAPVPLFVRVEVASSPGLAFVAFSAAMLGGRLISDRLVEQLGSITMLMIGGVILALAFGSMVVVESPVATIVAFGIAGLGASPVFPVSFSIAGRLPLIATGTAVGAVSWVSRARLLIAPLLVGGTATALSFGFAFTVIALAGLAIVVLAAILRGRLSGSHESEVTVLWGPLGHWTTRELGHWTTRAPENTGVERLGPRWN